MTTPEPAPAQQASTTAPTPFWWGDAACPLLGWYHPPQGAVRQCGVVLCPPFGHEYLVAHRSYKKLAERLAAAGFPVVFFDYDGTGDSADSDKPRAQAWQDNIAQAMQTLKNLSGVPEVALFGVRLGALLAASVAAAQATAALMLFAPVLSGRRYVRELQAFARMSPIPPSADPAQAMGDDEVTGYPLDSQTQADLGALDLLKIASALPTRSFIASRDDMGGQDDKLITAMRASGKAPTVAGTSGYAAMMTDDAYSAQVPAALWDEITGWMAGQFPATTGSAPPVASLTATMQLRVEGVEVCETLVTFDGLSGVLTEPVAGAQARAAVVLTNVGSSHRVANHRLHVGLARHLASQGFGVLRFDRAGMGYSRNTPDGRENEVYAPSGTDDVRAAMDFLQQTRAVARFVLAGLCSGAYFSYKAAAADPRAVGLVMLNPLTFDWRDGDSLELRIENTFKSSSFYLRAITDPAIWRRALRGDIALGRIAGKLLQRAWQRVSGAARAAWQRLSKAPPKPGPVAADFLRMKARGTELFFVLGADDSAIDVVAEHLGPNASQLGETPLLRLDVVPHTDHTFTPRWSQQHLKHTLGDYLLERFG